MLTLVAGAVNSCNGHNAGSPAVAGLASVTFASTKRFKVRVKPANGGKYTKVVLTLSYRAALQRVGVYNHKGCAMTHLAQD